MNKDKCPSLTETVPERLSKNTGDHETRDWRTKQLLTKNSQSGTHRSSITLRSSKFSNVFKNLVLVYTADDFKQKQGIVLKKNYINRNMQMINITKDESLNIYAFTS